MSLEEGKGRMSSAWIIKQSFSTDCLYPCLKIFASVQGLQQAEHNLVVYSSLGRQLWIDGAPHQLSLARRGRVWDPARLSSGVLFRQRLSTDLAPGCK